MDSTTCADKKGKSRHKRTRSKGSSTSTDMEGRGSTPILRSTAIFDEGAVLEWGKTRIQRDDSSQQKKARRRKKSKEDALSSSSSDAKDGDSKDTVNIRSHNITLTEAMERFNLPDVIDRCVNPGDLALTFDDGLTDITSGVLKILGKYKIRGTFFIIGNTLDSGRMSKEEVKRLLKQMRDGGHVIGSHSYSHPDFNFYCPEGIHYEMSRTLELFDELIGIRPRIMRPPYGSVNGQVIQALHSSGYFIVKWNVDTNDWLYKNSTQQSLQEFKDRVPKIETIEEIKLQKTGLNQESLEAIIRHSLGSKIVLMHDNHRSILSLLPNLIQHAKSLGYRFVTMDECLGGINPNRFED